MGLGKKKVSNMSSKMAVKVKMLNVTMYKVAAILGFQKIAVYFKLNYFELIHLQAIMLSSFIFTYFAVKHTNFSLSHPLEDNQSLYFF